MNLIEKAEKHFQSTHEIIIEEWDETVYFQPMTLAERSKIMEMSDKHKEDHSYVIHVVIEKALDKDGNKLFNLGDYNSLANKVDSSVLSRISNRILNPTQVKEEKKDS